MNVVDSSGWLEYFADGPNARKFLPPLRDHSKLIVPVATIYEVFEVVLRERGENEALLAVAVMQKGTVVEVNAKLAIEAAVLGVKHHLPLANNLILATARAHSATIWTQDADFRPFSNVKYFPPKK